MQLLGSEVEHEYDKEWKDCKALNDSRTVFNSSVPALWASRS